MRSSTVSSISLLICLFSLATLATASAQLAPVSMPPLNEPLEKYDNPPAVPRKIETSPRMLSPYAGFISYQANVRSEEHTSELQSRRDLVCRLLLEKKKKKKINTQNKI